MDKMDKEKQAYVICNWNERALGVIIQLHSDLLRFNHEDIPIMVVGAQDFPRETLMGNYGKWFYNVYFHRGDPSSPDVLNTLGLERCISVLVLAEGGDQTDSDARSLLTFMALRSLREERDLHFRVVLEITNSTTFGQYMTMLTPYVEEGWLEILVADDIDARIYSQTARVMGLAQTYFDLLKYSRDTCEVYRVRVPAFLDGLDFIEAHRRLRRPGGDEPGCLLVGLASAKRRGLITTNPLPIRGATPERPLEDVRIDMRKHDLVVISVEPPSFAQPSNQENPS